MVFVGPIRSIVLAAKVRKLRRYVLGARQSREVQHRVLLEKIRRCESSTFGREHEFAKIRTVADFRAAVPVTDYEYVRPYIERVMAGETAAMFAPGTRILMFAMTSGTTAKAKYLPVTREFYNEYRASWQYWGTSVYRDHPELLFQQTLQLTSDWQMTRAPSGVACGNISGLAAETRPVYARRMFVLPSAVVRIHNTSAKHYTALRIAMATPKVGMLITANPSTLVEFAKRGDRERERLIRDIHDGTLAADEHVPSEVRARLARHLRRNPRRANELERLVGQQGRLVPVDYWPQLRVLAVWTGGSVGVYLPQLAEFYGQPEIRDHGISASEGRMTIPFRGTSGAGMLDYGQHFFEFIPAEEYGDPRATVLEAHELERGRDYYILLTTSGGLYRYDIHDLVRCEGFEGQAPLLVFMNKGRHFSSVTGEKLSEHQVVQAVSESLAALQLPSCTFTVAPHMLTKPQYQLIVEPGPQVDAGQRLADEVQRRLAILNLEYADKCGSGRILPVVIRQVPRGTWAALRYLKSRERGNFEEYKHPCLSSDLEYIAKLPSPSILPPAAVN